VVLLQELSSDYAAGGAPVLDEICSSIKNAVAVNHGIQIYDVVLLKNNTLLKTSSGKIQRGACRAEYLSGKLSMISDTPTERYAGKGKPQTRQGHHSNMV
jgi:acyl-CoA synthetase (AMP-forming)/AMP-acid ligase II